MEKTSQLTFHKNVTSKPITVKQWRDIRDSHENEFDRELAIVCASTGLDESALLEMDTPDYNTLVADCVELVTMAAHELQGVEFLPTDRHYPLMQPFDNAVGQTINDIVLKLPKVKHSKALDALTDEAQRENFVFMSVTGLTGDDILLLTTNDYKSLDAMVADFFYKGAAFFSPASK